jgi:hypothetical protein
MPMTATTASGDIAKAKVASELKAAVEFLKVESRKMKEYSKKEDALLPPAQAAAMLGISPQAINKRMREGSLRSYQVFGKTYLAGKQIEEMMVERLKRLLAAGTDKNELEKSIYKKWVVNSKLAKEKRG